MSENNTIPTTIEYLKLGDIRYYKIQKLNFIYSSSKQFTALSHIQQTISLKQKSKSNLSGVIFTSELEFQIGSDDNAILSELQSIINTPLIMRITYIDGTQRILGNHLKPVYISYDTSNIMNNIINVYASVIDILRFSVFKLINSFSTSFNFSFNI